jgi:hypothetical protein
MPGKSLEDMTVDELLAHARQTESQASLLQTLTKNPDTRETIQRAIKKLNPNLSIPEIDAKDAVRAEIATERDERLKLERQILERDARDNVRERRTAIREKYKLTDTDVTAIEAMMVEDKEVNWTHDAAARVYLASRKSAEPTPSIYSAPTFDMPEKDVWAPGIGSPAKLNKIALEQAAAAWNELAGGKVAGLGGARLN